MALLLCCIILLATAVSTAAPWWSERIRHGCALVGGLASSVIGVLAVAPVLVRGRAIHVVDDLLVVDSPGAFLLILVFVVAMASTVASVCYIRRERHHNIITVRQERLYYSLLSLFVLTMVLAGSANNIAVLWIALEATTLSTTLLVAFRRTTGSIEAAWKYIVLCSTGITLGLLGVLMMSYAGQASGATPGTQAFLLTELRAHATALAPATVRWAFVFLLIGIGTKVGLVPMHTWLPDAHSKTPSPISALLSGVLLNVAFVVLLRFKLVTDLALGSSAWTDQLFRIFGILSIVIPALILLSQRNYKRMLGYSSVEHMGMMTFAVGLGPFGLVPALMHMAGHALAKPLLFLGAGELLDTWKSTTISDVRDACTRAPRTALLFLFGMFMLLAVPPSALFVSEMLVVGYGITTHPILTALFLVSLTVTMIAMSRIVIPMLFGAGSSEQTPPPGREHWNVVHTVLLVLLVGTLMLGGWCMSQSGIAFLRAIAASLSS